MIANTKMSPTLVQKISSHGCAIQKRHKKLKDVVKRLVLLRNDILSIIKGIKDFDIDNQMYDSYQKEDYITICDLCLTLKNSEYFKPTNLWGLKIKPTGKESYSASEYSE